ncbi:hypothetical protein BP6252_11489 [Coleophoma cylindrospora]|uniref:2EXR domain-containing protein n=1 Tax=Coleophoma cylindrospora TaxID=1849047 RepID=A0A3D8QJQ5_9HELO|nr:hypothetical protein BP6252_11489 [Coleophoma cylindrospora]
MASLSPQTQPTGQIEPISSSPVVTPEASRTSRKSEPEYLLSNSINPDKTFKFCYDLYKYKPLKHKLTKFHVFANLPVEVRCMIWVAALPGPRLLYLQSQKMYCEVEGGEEGTTFEIISAIQKCGRRLTLLATTQESRWVTMKSYKILLPQAPYDPSPEDTFKYSVNVFVDFEIDTLCTVLDFALLDFLNHFPNLKIKNLALIITELWPNDAESWTYLLESLPQLQNLTFVLGVPKDRALFTHRGPHQRALMGQVASLNNIVNSWPDENPEFWSSLALYERMLLDREIRGTHADFVLENPQWDHINFNTAMYLEKEEGSCIWRGFLETEMSTVDWMLEYGFAAEDQANIRPVGEMFPWVAENICLDNGRLLTPVAGAAVNITRFD